MLKDVFCLSQVITDGEKKIRTVCDPPQALESIPNQQCVLKNLTTLQA